MRSYLLKKGVIGKKLLGIAVSFRDKRGEKKKLRDKFLNIHQVKGDVMDSKTWRDVDKELGGRKADLIMERAAGGFSATPNDPIFYAAILVKIWKLLSDDGGMFVGEIYNSGFTERFSNQIANYLRRNNIDILIKNKVVRIIKTPSSPKDIGPILRGIGKLDSLTDTWGHFEGYSLPNKISSAGIGA